MASSAINADFNGLDAVVLNIPAQLSLLFRGSVLSARDVSLEEQTHWYTMGFQPFAKLPGTSPDWEGEQSDAFLCHTG